MENKEFAKTTELEFEKFYDLLDDKFGVTLKLNDVPTQNHLIMEIVAPVKKKVVPAKEEGDDDKVFYNIPCRYYHSKFAGGSADLDCTVSEGAVGRLEEKYPNNSYVGMKAFFQKTKYGGKYPQFINPIKNPIDIKHKDDLLAKKDTVSTVIEQPVPNKVSLPSVEDVNPDLKVINELVNNPQLGSWVVHAKKGVDEFVEAYNGTADRLGMDKIDLAKKEHLYKVFLAK
jgi:hypothetical protein